MNTPRTLIIGLDGATFDLIDPWARAGYLPTLAKLMAQGVRGPLRVWPNLNSAAAWSSIVTGYNPGQHGVYGFSDASPPGGTAWLPTTAAARRKDPFWRLLSAAGQRVGVINVPITYPAEPVNGFMLAGMDAPGVHSSGFAHPPDLRDELRRQRIDYVIDVPNLALLARRDPRQIPRPVQQMVDARSRAILHLMQTYPWDVLMAVFVATDRAQHFFWPAEDVPPESPEWAPIRSLYQQIDSFFNDALAIIDENTTVLVVSDHGFGPERPVKRNLNSLFAQLGLLRYRQGGSSLKSRLLKDLLLYGRKLIPFSLQNPLARAFPRLHLRAWSEHMLPNIEWSLTQAFVHRYGGGAFINLQGRQPEGTVSPEDYDPLRERVREILLNLIDPTTGRRVVRGVYRREEIYHGPYAKQAADLLIEWEDQAVQDALCYPAEGEPAIIQARKSSRSGELWPGWTAGHRPQGVFIAYGPHIRRGAMVANASIYSIAPTILYLQDHPIPGEMDGKVLTDIFTEEQLRHYPVQRGEPASVRAEEAETLLDAEEAREIEERLRGLGYIE